MTNPPILTIDREALAGIIKRGKPAGLYMAKSEAFPGAAVSAQWTGVDSRPGHLCLMKHGTFAEVITWLMVRAGVLKQKQTVLNRNASRDPEYQGRRETGAEVRIPGAQIKAWKEPGASIEGPKELRPEGAKRWDFESSPRMVRNREINEEILRRLEDGETYDQIGEAVGISAARVCDRLKHMKERGVSLPPLRDEREKKRIAERDETIRELIRGGLTIREIADRFGTSYQLIYKRVKTLKGKGLVP
jgi:transposase